MRLSDHDFLIWANFMTEFGENLRWLCGLRKSVSFVARELGINRQQFGRYVNNKSYPDTHNLIAICDYFNVQAADFELPHSEFSQKYRKVSLLKQGPAQRTLEFPLDAYFRQSPRLLERFRGDYLIYFNTKTWPDHYMIAFVACSRVRMQPFCATSSEGANRFWAIEYCSKVAGRQRSLNITYLFSPIQNPWLGLWCRRSFQFGTGSIRICSRAA